MALLDPLEDGELHLGMPLTLRFAGAESNFAIALSRLGIDVAWISKLGRDPFGDLILAAVAGEGVETRWVLRDDAPGPLLQVARGRKVACHLPRASSAASRLQVGDVPDEALDGVQVVHLTGITMAISVAPASSFSTSRGGQRSEAQRSSSIPTSALPSRTRPTPRPLGNKRFWSTSTGTSAARARPSSSGRTARSRSPR